MDSDNQEYEYGVSRTDNPERVFGRHLSREEAEELLEDANKWQPSIEYFLVRRALGKWKEVK